LTSKLRPINYTYFVTISSSFQHFVIISSFVAPGLCLPPPAALEGLDAWQSQGDSEKGDAPVAVAPPPKLEKAVTEETKETKEAKEAKETKPAAPQAVLPWAAPPPGPGLFM